MNRVQWYLVLGVCLAGFAPLVMVGCALKGDVEVATQEAKEDIINNDNKNTESLSDQHVKILQGDVDGLKLSVEDAKRRSEEVQIALAQETAAAKENAARFESWLTILGGAFEAVSHGDLSGVVSNVLQQTYADAVTKEEYERSRQAVDAAIARKADEKQVQAVVDDLSESKKQIQAMRDTLAQISPKLGSLSDDGVQKLLGLDTKALENLRELGKTDPTKMKEEFLLAMTKTGVRGGDIKSIEPLSPGEILAIIGVVLGGGAIGTGGGAALSKLGKSRAEPRIDSIEVKLAALETSLGQDGKRAKPYLDELFERIDNLEVRTARVKNNPPD